jgi:transcriptional regulator with XRE-family HTH domain
VAHRAVFQENKRDLGGYLLPGGQASPLSGNGRKVACPATLCGMRKRAQAGVRLRRIVMELKRLRKEAGLNLDEVAKQLGVHASTISRMESGDRGLKRDDLAAVLVVYGATRKLRMAMLHLYDQAEQPGLLDNTDLVLPDSLVALVGFEEDATSIRNYETLLIPGLAQTIPYARAGYRGLRTAVGGRGNGRPVGRSRRQAVAPAAAECAHGTAVDQRSGIAPEHRWTRGDAGAAGVPGRAPRPAEHPSGPNGSRRASGSW